MELAPTDYSVQDLVERVRASLHPLAADKGLEFVVSVPESVPWRTATPGASCSASRISPATR